MFYFEKVSTYKDVDLPLPTRATDGSCGYDFVVAKDIIVPSIQTHIKKMLDFAKEQGEESPLYDLEDMANITKMLRARPTLVPTGIKCYLDPGYYLELSVRSSTPLKYWLIMANGVGIIDTDFYNAPNAEEGHIHFPLINLSPFDILLKRGDRIGQGVIHQFATNNGEKTLQNSRTGGLGSTT